MASGRFDPACLETLIRLQEEAVERVAKAPELSPMEASDREDAVGEWLEDHGISGGWDLAPTFVQAGLEAAWLDQVAAVVDDGTLEASIRWLNYTVETELLMNEIEDSTKRVSHLVTAAKQYSQLDRAPYQVVDVHELLKSTLMMLHGKLGDGITVVKDFDRSLPPIPGYPAELNQVWTNLIDNAVSAMDGHGTLTVRTARDDDRVLVEIADTGPGIPRDIQSRIFEPFFTTKPVGEGTGLGLDISYRIVVNRHHGDLRVESEPGNTRFQVRLPITVAPDDSVVVPDAGTPDTDDPGPGTPDTGATRPPPRRAEWLTLRDWTRPPRRAAPAAWNARRRRAGGSTCAGAPSAGTSAAVTAHRPSTPARTPRPAAIRWCAASSRASRGSGATPTSSSTTARNLPRRSTIRWTSRCPARPGGSPPTGAATCTRSSSPGQAATCTKPAVVVPACRWPAAGWQASRMGIVSPGFKGRPRSGREKLPPGQYLVTDFPVLSAGPTPRVKTGTWEFRITTETGEVHTWDWAAFQALPAEEFTVDLHCVTKWSKLAHRLAGRVAGHAPGPGPDQRRVRAGPQLRRVHHQPAAGATCWTARRGWPSSTAGGR